MADSRAAEILSEHARMVSQRSTFEDQWAEVAERVIPRKNFFRGKQGPNQEKGQRKTEKIFDSTPALALDRYAAAVRLGTSCKRSMKNCVMTPRCSATLTK
jgi:hypothetical protein